MMAEKISNIIPVNSEECLILINEDSGDLNIICLWLQAYKWQLKNIC